MKLSLLACRVKQCDVPIRSRNGEHDARESGAGPDVNDGARALAVEDGEESQGIDDVFEENGIVGAYCCEIIVTVCVEEEVGKLGECVDLSLTETGSGGDFLE